MNKQELLLAGSEEITSHRDEQDKKRNESRKKRKRTYGKYAVNGGIGHNVDPIFSDLPAHQFLWATKTWTRYYQAKKNSGIQV